MPTRTGAPRLRVLTGDLSGWTSQTLPLVNYLNAASFVPLYAVGRLVGVWHGAADFRAQYFRDPTPFIFAGRFVAACLGALTAVLAALIAGRLGLSREVVAARRGHGRRLPHGRVDVSPGQDRQRGRIRRTLAGLVDPLQTR